MFYARRTDLSVNPTVGNEYASPSECTMLVLRKVTRAAPSAPIVLSGAGHSYNLKVGQTIPLTADSTGRTMGQFRVEAIVLDKLVVGEVPTRKLRHYVMK